jgi:protein involved in polysaccharide export with SLBB domain
MKYTATKSAFVLFMFTASVFIWPIQALEEEQEQTPLSAGIQTQVQIAISSPSYPVTAGDVYSLTYTVGSAPVVYTITVDSSYRIRVSNLGIINVAGKTYPELKRDVETIVSNNYPLSGVQLVLIKPSSFTVYIKGEVISAGERTTWALGRLSSLVDDNFYEYSSTRNITITSANGQVKTCDLFKAQRFGDIKEDPYLRPGDVITIKLLDRKVFVFGEVKRPGFYELLPGENIQELLHNYANGYTSRADTGKIELIRDTGNDHGMSDTLHLTQEEINANFPLWHSDVIYIPLK